MNDRNTFDDDNDLRASMFNDAVNRVVNNCKRPSLLSNAQRRMLAEELDGLTPLQILMSIARDEDEDMDYRIKACTIMMPYVHKKMPIATEVIQPAITVLNMAMGDVRNISDNDLDIAIRVLDKIGVKALPEKTIDPTQNEAEEIIESVARKVGGGAE